MIYSTQSVTGVSTDLLDQTENFFIAHLASDGKLMRCEVKILLMLHLRKIYYKLNPLAILDC